MFRKIFWNQNPARTTLLFVSISLCTMTTSNKLAAQNSTVTKVAFIVGVEKYDKEGLRDLDYAEDDAIALKKSLEKQKFTVTMLLGSATGEERATLENIQSKWQGFVTTIKKLKKDDLVLVAISGHGVQLNVPNPQTMKTVDDEFYCPVDGQKDDPSSLWSLSKLIDDLGDYSGSSKNLFLMDACRFASGKGKGLDAGSVNLKNKCGILLACETGKKAHEYEDLKHGLFTYYVLEALKGKGTAKNSDNVVTWDSLASYVKEQVIRESALRQQDQTPNKMENLPGKPPILADTFTGEVIDGGEFDASKDPRTHAKDENPYSEVTFTGTFKNTDFTDTYFKDCRFENCTFVGFVRVYGARMIDCQLIDCDFRAGNTHTLTLQGTDPKGALYASNRKPRIVKKD